MCGTVAASSKLMLGGLCAHARSAPQAYSPKAPYPNCVRSPKTSSPGRNAVTPCPTDSTSPAASNPSPAFFGRRIPVPMRVSIGRPYR